MATLNASPASTTTVTWSISGLTQPFKTDHYIRVVLSNSPAVNDSANPPSGILSSIYATSSGSSTTAGPQTTSGGNAFSPGNTYFLYGTAQAANGRYYNAGSSSVTMPALPGAVTGLTRIGATANSISVSWNTASNATGYHMYRNDSYVISVSGTAYTFGGLSAGTQYKLSVVPYNSWGTGIGQSIWEYTGSARPPNFSWTYTKTPGADIYVHNAEWTALGGRVNQFRAYKGLSAVSFMPVGSGTTISASIYNQMRNAIAAMSPPTGPPAVVTPGVTTIAASHFNLLRDSLNSIS